MPHCWKSRVWLISLLVLYVAGIVYSSFSTSGFSCFLLKCGYSVGTDLLRVCCLLCALVLSVYSKFAIFMLRKRHITGFYPKIWKNNAGI